ncbi:MAG: VWA domain-containing protein, partial [Clostridiales bacterium]|nr:VWA domain-containing protein [Clostridiales bacterium]
MRMKKKIPKRVLAMFLSLALVLALVPAAASFAADDSGETTTSGIELSKTVTLVDDGTYTINLEAYATGTVTSTAEKQPLDIILVLDQSGSMAYDFSGSQTLTNSSRRQYAMKAAVDSFIDAVYEDSTELDGQDGDVEHRVGIVTFGSSSSTLCSLQSVETGYNTLTGAVSGLPDSPSGATNTSAGMTTANNMIDTTSAGRQTIVILFTDGVPTTGTTFSKTVADGAISAAKSMKDKGAIVYTVGIFSGVDTTYIGAVNDTLKISGNNNNETDAANRFMNLVSSNTTTATDMGMTSSSTGGGVGQGDNDNSYTITTNYDYSSKGYYKTATSASELENVFSEIQKESAGTTVTLDSESVLKDIMGDGFELSVSDASCVTVQTADYLGNGEFDTAVTFSDAVVTVENNTVSVSGFDYKSNYVVNASGSVAASGKKLIVTIKGVLPTESVTTGDPVYTNAATSGIYATSESEEPTATFEQPQTIITKKLYVLDYAKTATLSNLDQNSVTGIVSSYQKVTSDNSSLTQSYGKSALSSNTLTYTPTTTNWNGYDSLYVFGQTTNTTVTALEANKNGNLWSKVSVIPANNVYYEDDFVTTYTDDSKTKTATVGIEYTGNWDEVNKTDEADKNTETANGSTHGWESTLADDTGYSDGSAHAIGTAGAKATFTFTGTGVDIYSRTDMVSGTVIVNVKSDDVNYSQTYVCDDLSTTAVYYQIPTVCFNDLEYATYTVTITVATNGSTSGETYTYYLDGVRVYNPLGETVTGDAEEAYAADNELNAVFTEVRSILIDNETFTEKYSGAGGVVFIDDNVNAGTAEEGETETAHSTSVIGTYADYGPENEVYLASGQSIAFKVNEAY